MLYVNPGGRSRRNSVRWVSSEAASVGGRRGCARWANCRGNAPSTTQHVEGSFCINLLNRNKHHIIFYTKKMLMTLRRLGIGSEVVWDSGILILPFVLGCEPEAEVAFANLSWVLAHFTTRGESLFYASTPFKASWNNPIIIDHKYNTSNLKIFFSHFIFWSKIFLLLLTSVIRKKKNVFELILQTFFINYYKKCPYINLYLGRRWSWYYASKTMPSFTHA